MRVVSDLTTSAYYALYRRSCCAGINKRHIDCALPLVHENYGFQLINRRALWQSNPIATVEGKEEKKKKTFKDCRILSTKVLQKIGEKCKILGSHVWSLRSCSHIHTLIYLHYNLHTAYHSKTSTL